MTSFALKQRLLTGTRVKRMVPSSSRRCIRPMASSTSSMYTSTVAENVAALHAALERVDDWPEEQRVREQSPSPRRPGKQRDDAGGRVHGDEPFAPYAGKYRGALDRVIATLSEQLDQDIALYQTYGCVVVEHSRGRGRRRDERRRQLVASVLALLRREGVPITQTPGGVAARGPPRNPAWISECPRRQATTGVSRTRSICSPIFAQHFGHRSTNSAVSVRFGP